MTGREPAVDGGAGGAAGDSPERAGARQNGQAEQDRQVTPPGFADPPAPADLIDVPDPARHHDGTGAAGESHTEHEEHTEQHRPPFRDMMLDSIGGWRGMFDSGFPVLVFVLANTVGGLRAAVWAAVAAGVVLMTVRLALKQSVQQSISGFVAVAVAAFIAARTGQAKGFFLLGIWASFVYAGVFAASVLARRPAVGVIWEYVDGGGTGWRRERASMRTYTWTTLLWVAVFLSRGLVQRFLYNEDRTGWLAFARVAMGYPFTAVALGVTLLAVRRARQARQAAPEPEPANPEP